jgi:hypothetical protein
MRGQRSTACNYARPAGIYSVLELYNFTEEDSDLSTCGDQLITGVKLEDQGEQADLIRS